MFLHNIFDNTFCWEQGGVKVEQVDGAKLGGGSRHDKPGKWQQDKRHLVASGSCFV